VSAFDELASLSPLDVWPGLAARSVHGERVTLTVVELDPNAAVDEHAHEQEQLGLVIAGSATFRIGDETREVRPGAIWVIPSNVPHEVHAGPDGAVLVDVFAPPRVDWAAREQPPPRPTRWP